MGLPHTVIALSLYYIAVWLLLQHTVKPTSVVVAYEPPDGLSPAALQLVYCSFHKWRIHRRDGCADSSQRRGKHRQAQRRQLSPDPQRHDDIQRNSQSSSGVDGQALLEGLIRARATELFPAIASGRPTRGIRTLQKYRSEIFSAGQDAKRVSAASAALHEMANNTIEGKYYRWNLVYVFLGMMFTLGYG